MKVLFIHAYSTTNSGDGLLVEEAVELVRDALPNIEYTVLALDPESFDDASASAVLHPLTGLANGIGGPETLARGILAAVTGRRSRRVEEILRDSDLVVAVGGGYLRTKDLVETVKTVFTHYVQLPRRRDATPFVYLPQSIGPLNFGTRKLFLKRLIDASITIARDGRSHDLIQYLPNADRAPDLALLGLPKGWAEESLTRPEAPGPVGIVARALAATKPRKASYDSRISDLAMMQHAELLVQATARGNNDPAYYESIGVPGPFRTLKDSVVLTANNRPAVVVSVRLHGAIQTIRSGVPSIHLSYERKGWGAYEDLGISRFVHNAFDFDVDVIRDQVAELRADPTEFWNSVRSSVTRLTAERRRLIAIISETASGSLK